MLSNKINFKFNSRGQDPVNLRILRIDELIIPYMNGESLSDVPEHFAAGGVIEHQIGNIYHHICLVENATWQQIFEAIDQLLINSGQRNQLDLVGLTRSGDRLQPIWASW